MSACAALKSFTCKFLSPPPCKPNVCLRAQWRTVQGFRKLLLRDGYVPQSRASCCSSVDIAAWQRQIQALCKAAQVGLSTVPVESYCSTGTDGKTNLGVNPVLHTGVQRHPEFWAMTRGNLGKSSWWSYWLSYWLCTCSSDLWTVKCKNILKWIL